MANKHSRGIGIYVVMLLVLMLLAMFVFSSSSGGVSIRYPQLLRLFDEYKVSRYVVDFSNGEMELEIKLKPSEIAEYLGQKTATGEIAAPQISAGTGGIFGGLFGAGSNTAKTLDPDKETKLKLNYRLPNIGLFIERVDLEKYAQEYNARNPEDRITSSDWDWRPPKEASILTMLLPYLVMIGAMALLYFFMMRQAGGGGGKMMSFSKAKVKNADDGRRVTFGDVAGADEEKEELVEIVEFLKNPGRFNALGARIPKGVLLVGPPGTGKTLLARAVAGEAGVPFFSISGSDFVEMFVGVGASRVRDLFENAKKNAPSIIFIDEIDAVGRHRGAGLGGGHDEREQTLNQLLVEMDGFGANTGVIIVAATNRRDILDPALLRPGRFDRQIIVGYPDVKGREEILRVHTRNKPIAPDVELKTIAKTTVGFTGADLENLMNEAALLAARANRKAVTMPDVEAATIKVVAGPEKRSHVVTDKDKNLTAYHEAGHAVVRYYCKTLDKVHEVSIIPRGMAGGYTMSLPEEDTNYHTKSEMEENIVTLLAGRMAEKLVLDDISTGASNDIERATKIARSMVTQYGFSEKLGPIVYGQNEQEVFLGRDFNHTRNYSENIAAEIDSEIRCLVDDGYERAEEILRGHIDELHRVSKFLFNYEKVDAAGFEKLMRGDDSVYEDYERKMKEREEEENRIRREREEENKRREQKKKAGDPPRTGNAYVDGEPPREPSAPGGGKLNPDEFYPPVKTGPIKDGDKAPEKEPPAVKSPGDPQEQQDGNNPEKQDQD